MDRRLAAMHHAEVVPIERILLDLDVTTAHSC
jgi:hypothetical protein